MSLNFLCAFFLLTLRFEGVCAHVCENVLIVDFCIIPCPGCVCVRDSCTYILYLYIYVYLISMCILFICIMLIHISKPLISIQYISIDYISYLAGHSTVQYLSVQQNPSVYPIFVAWSHLLCTLCHLTIKGAMYVSCVFLSRNKKDIIFYFIPKKAAFSHRLYLYFVYNIYRLFFCHPMQVSLSQLLSIRQ